MTYEIGLAILFAAFAVGFILWWLALRACLKLRSAADSGALGRFFAPESEPKPDGMPEEAAYAGSAGLCGIVGVPPGVQRDRYLKELRRILEDPVHTMGQFSQAGPTGPIFEIVDQTPDGIAFVNKNTKRSAGFAAIYEEGRVTLVPAKDPRVHAFAVAYELDAGPVISRWSLWMMALMVGIELPVIVLLPVLLAYYVLPSPNPGVSAQTLQVLQMAHVLWPPFLSIRLMKNSLRSSKILFEAFLKSAATEAQREAGR